MISDERGATQVRISRPEPFEHIPQTPDGIYLVLHEPAAGGIIVVADAAKTTTIDLEERLKVDGIKPSGPYNVPHSGTVNYPTRERTIYSYFAVRDGDNWEPSADVVAKKLEAAGIPPEMVFSEDYSSARERFDSFAQIASADYAPTLKRLISERVRLIRDRVLGEKRRQERASSLAGFYKTLAENTPGNVISVAIDTATNYALVFFANRVVDIRAAARTPFDVREIGILRHREFGWMGYIQVRSDVAERLAGELDIADRITRKNYRQEGIQFSEPPDVQIFELIDRQVRTLYERP